MFASCKGLMPSATEVHKALINTTGNVVIVVQFYIFKSCKVVNICLKKMLKPEIHFICNPSFISALLRPVI